MSELNPIVDHKVYEKRMSMSLLDKAFFADKISDSDLLVDFGCADGLRQDSGDPEIWADTKVIPHYAKYNIPTRDKKLIFSDNLNVEKGIKLTNKYNSLFNVILGIGTFLTNDTFTEEQKLAGIRPLNMVIKITSANFGKGWYPTVKLSDDIGKNLGNMTMINHIKEELHIK